jgi:hypothetical protein
MTAGRRSVKYLSLLVAAAATLLVPGTVQGGRAAACVPSGTEAGINAALAGAGATAVLCPGAVFTLTHPVIFTPPTAASTSSTTRP